MNLSLNKNQRLGLILILIIAGGFGVYFIGDYVGLWSVAPETPTATEKLTSTFTFIDYNTGEDVSAWVEGSVWTPDEDDLPFDDEDPYTLGNFDEEEENVEAEDLSIDLRDYTVAWLEVDPQFQSDYGGYDAGVLYGDGVVTQSRDFRKLIGGGNYDYTVYVYHIPTNVSISMQTKGVMLGTGNIGDARPYNSTFFNGVPGAAYIRSTNGTYQVTLEMPWQSTHGYHAGETGQDEWDMDAEELAEIVADGAVHSYDIDTDLNWVQDQSNHRTIAPLYDLTDDDNHDFDNDLERLTNTFAIEFTFNDTVSLEDHASAGVNITILERDGNNVPAQVVYSATNIFIIFYKPFTCYNQQYNFDIQLGIGAKILLTTVETCRIVVPRDDTNLGAITLLNTMLLTNYA